jgi:hypothetical protein
MKTAETMKEGSIGGKDPHRVVAPVKKRMF